MAKGNNRNLRLADWLHTYLHEEGAKSVREIMNYINHEHPTKKTLDGRESRKTKNSYTHNQIAGVLKSNPLFLKVGGAKTRSKSTNTRRWVADWEARPIREVVDNMVERRESGIRLRRFYPQVIKNEFKRRGLEL